MNKFKTTFFLTAAVALALSFTMEKILPNSKLAAVFSATQLAEKTDDQIDYMNFVSTNGYIVHHDSKSADFPMLSSVIQPGFASTIDYANLTTENFNPYMLSISPGDTHQFFLVDGTSKTVQLYSESYIQKRYGQLKINEKNALNRKK